jgi:catechol 2,3-dioxygenase-like lactoylglutathione lyase family enzyme
MDNSSTSSEPESTLPRPVPIRHRELGTAAGRGRGAVRRRGSPYGLSPLRATTGPSSPAPSPSPRARKPPMRRVSVSAKIPATAANTLHLVAYTVLLSALVIQSRGRHPDAAAKPPPVPFAHDDPLPLATFDHMTREVASVDVSAEFYISVLGMKETPRPMFEQEGRWMYGHGLALHLIQSHRPSRRRELHAARVAHFSQWMPSVDHFAFVIQEGVSLDPIEARLRGAGVVMKRFKTPLDQIMLLDPDGNVVEIASCGNVEGQSRCVFS